MTVSRGSEIVCSTLEALGVRCVFGVPGTQNVALYEALRRSSIRSVLATHELGAGFMANGYYRASGEVGVVATIPGPGFTVALTGLAEAIQDSAALLHITGQPARSQRKHYEFQYVNQAAIAGPIVKQVFDVEAPERISAVISEAYRLALAGEPGPVLVQISQDALLGTSLESTPPAAPAGPQPPAPNTAQLDQAVARLAAARRPVILAGQGAAGAARELKELVERCSIPVATTLSGRGVIPEDHPFALSFNSQRGDVRTLNELLETADVILALGCKLTHNGTVGFRLRLPHDRLIRVNTDRAAGAEHYPASLTMQLSVEVLLGHLLRALSPPLGTGSSWDAAEVGRWRERLQVPGAYDLPEPVLSAIKGGTAASFFTALRRALPRDGIVVTDSGLHQILTHRHFEVLAPRGLIPPTDFQTMGFGVPAAIGARLAAPGRPVVAVVGDGGFLATGLELVTAAREQVPLTVIVFNDGQLNQIRLQQYRDFGHSHDVGLGTPDLETIAAAFGLDFIRLEGDPEAGLRTAIAARQPTLVEVEVGDSAAIRLMRAKASAREGVRSLLGHGISGRLKHLFRGGGS